MTITANDSNFGEVKIIDYWCYICGAKIPTIIYSNYVAGIYGADTIERLINYSKDFIKRAETKIRRRVNRENDKTIINDQMDFANHALMLDLFCMTGIRGSVICTKYRPYQISIDNYKNIFSGAAYINIICGNTKHVYLSDNTYYKCVDGFNVETKKGVNMVRGVYEYLFCDGNRDAEIEVWHRVGEDYK